MASHRLIYIQTHERRIKILVERIWSTDSRLLVCSHLTSSFRPISVAMSVESKAYKDYLPPRDFVGYGFEQPTDCWPNKAAICVSFVLNCMLFLYLWTIRVIS